MANPQITIPPYVAGGGIYPNKLFTTTDIEWATIEPVEEVWEGENPWGPVEVQVPPAPQPKNNWYNWELPTKLYKSKIDGEWTTMKKKPWESPYPKGKEIKPIVEDLVAKQQVVDDLIRLGAFLHGSRDRFNNHNIKDSTDWDFAIDNADSPNQPSTFSWEGDNAWQLVEEPLSELAQYVKNNFHYDNGPDNYKDNMFKGLYKHNTFPSITVGIKLSLNLWKRVWNKVPHWYWEEWLWKSHPKYGNKMSDPSFQRQWRDRANATWNMLYEILEVKDIQEYL